MGLSPESKPKCEYKGKDVGILRDRWPANECGINKKRSDGTWSEWSRYFYETADEYKDLEERVCLYQAHGGEGCEGLSRKGVWWVVIRQALTFGEADDKCREIGGRLYYDVNTDGFLEELDRMFQKIPGKNFWLGIHDLFNTRPLETGLS